MLNLKDFINKEEIIKLKLASRGVATEKVDEIKALAKKRSELMQSLQNLEAKKNQFSKEIGVLKAKNKSTNKVMKNVALIKLEIEKIKGANSEVNNEINYKLLNIQNLPLDVVPIGKDESKNIVLNEHIIWLGKVTNVQPHYEYGVYK